MEIYAIVKWHSLVLFRSMCQNWLYFQKLSCTYQVFQCYTFCGLFCISISPTMPKIWAMPAASLIRCKKSNSKDSQELLNRLAVRSTNCRSTGQQAIDRKRSGESTVHTLREDQVVPVFGHFTVGGRGHWPLAQLGLGRLPCSLPDPPPPPPPLFLA